MTAIISGEWALTWDMPSDPRVENAKDCRHITATERVVTSFDNLTVRMHVTLPLMVGFT